MKKVGITDTRSKMMANYLSWFEGENIDVVKLEVNSHDYKGCSGIVLTGGTDIHPDLYDGEQEYANKPDQWDEERDRYEEAVYNYAKINKIPILAICRGLQLVNVIEGGTMIQDLGEGNLVHKKENDIDREHKVAVDSDVTGGMNEIVNSAHHQAVEFPGKALMVSATSPDNVIEAMEFKDKTNRGFMVCVQWHPERIPDSQKMSKNLKRGFLNAIRSI